MIIRNLESLVECLKSEVYSDVNAYKTPEYEDIPYPVGDYDEVFNDDDDLTQIKRYYVRRIRYI